MDDHAHDIPCGFIPSREFTMPNTDAFALRQSGFNEFLFAAVGIEANGMTLSLVSVFARAGNDPWHEAGRLAELPKSEATESLARSIAGMPASIWPLQAAMAIADRLVALLPTRPDGAAQCPAVPAVGAKAARLLSIAVVVAGVACMLAFQAGLFTTLAPPNPDGSTLASFTAAPGSSPGVKNVRSTSAPAQ
jgi:hypothetical protein